MLILYKRAATVSQQSHCQSLSEDTYHLHLSSRQWANSWVRPPHLFPPTSRSCSSSTCRARQWQTPWRRGCLSWWPCACCPTWPWPRRRSCSRRWPRSVCFPAAAARPPSVSWRTRGRHWPLLGGRLGLKGGESLVGLWDCGSVTTTLHRPVITPSTEIMVDFQ